MLEFELAELRLVQERTITSAANALQIQLGPPPEGKIWNILGASYYPSVAETRVVSVYKTTRSGAPIGVLNPISLALNPDTSTPFEFGLTTFLLPGETLIWLRSAATAGSTMVAGIQFVEIDLPLYEYLEPQEKKRISTVRGTLLRRMSGVMGGGGGPASRPPGGRTSGGRSRL